MDARKLDPLYVIFEKYLYDYTYEDAEFFITMVVSEYLDYLKATRVTLPDKVVPTLQDDLTSEVYDMLVKKIYGNMSIKDYLHSGRVTRLDRMDANDRYKDLRLRTQNEE